MLAKGRKAEMREESGKGGWGQEEKTVQVGGWISLSIHQSLRFMLFPLWRQYAQCCYEHSQAGFCADMFSNLLSTHLRVELLDPVVQLLIIHFASPSPRQNHTSLLYLTFPN